MSIAENPFSVEKADDSSGFLLWQVTTLWQRKIRKALEPYELTHPQFVLMASVHWLTLHNKEVTQIVLSNHTKIDPMTTSTVLRSLQQRGLLQRHEHNTDTRAKIVLLTQEGINIVSKAVVAVEKFDKDFFSVLGADTANFNRKLTVLLSQKENNK